MAAWKPAHLACSSALATYSYLKWPGLAQVMRRTCQRINLRTGQVEGQTRYGLTSLHCMFAGPQLIEYFWRETLDDREWQSLCA